MNTDIPKAELERVGREYASICMERPKLFDLFTDWTAETSRRHFESCERLLGEFSDAGASTMDDLFRLELSACYCSELAGMHGEAKRRMARVAALSLLGLRYLSMVHNNESDDSNDKTNENEMEEPDEGDMEHDPGASGDQEGP